MKLTDTDYRLSCDYVRRSVFTREEWEAAAPFAPIGAVLFVECQLLDGSGRLLWPSTGPDKASAIRKMESELAEGHTDARRWLMEIIAKLPAEESHAPAAP